MADGARLMFAARAAEIETTNLLYLFSHSLLSC